MIASEASLIIDDQKREYELAYARFHPTFLSVSRVSRNANDSWSIQDPGPHFLLNIPADLAFSALERRLSVYCEQESDLGAMDWYRGAGGRDGTGRRGVANLNVSIGVLPAQNRYDLQILGLLADKEQIVPGTLPPPPHERFQLSLSFALDHLSELFENCPSSEKRISELLHRHPDYHM